MTRSRMILAVLALVMSASVAVGNAANASVSSSAARSTPTASELPTGPNYLCANYGDSEQCLYPHNGNFSDGNTIDVVNEIDTVVVQDICTIGFISGECQPFSSGSDCNSRYKNLEVVGIVWTNTVYTVRDYTASNDQVKVSDTTDFNAEWVISGHWIIDVGATNNAGVNCDTGNPYILTNRPDTGTVWTRPGGSYDASKQNWSFVP